MVQTVTIPEVGDIDFPDGMSHEEISAAIQNNFPQIHQQPAQNSSDNNQGFWARLLSGGIIDGSNAAQGMNPSYFASAKSREDAKNYLENLEKTSPAQAETIRSMGGTEKILANIGAGLSDVWYGLPGTGENPNLEYAKNLESSTAGGGLSRAVGESLPFLPAALAAGGIAGAAPRIATQAGIGGAQGGIIASGTGEDQAGIVKGALAGAALGGGIEALGSGIHSAVGALAKRPQASSVGPATEANIAENVASPAEAATGLNAERAARNLERENAFKKFGVLPTEAQRTRDKDLFRIQQDRAKAGGSVTDVIDTQEQAFSQAAERAIADTGGAPANAATSPVDVVVNKSLKQDKQISEAYKSAFESSNKQKIIKFNNAAAILRQSAPENELSGGVVSALRGHLEQNGILTGFSPTGRVDASVAEEMRKYANSLFPSTNDQGRAILRKFKDAIDNDTARAVGEDVFSVARQAKASFEKGLDREKFHKFDERNVNIVRDILNNKITPDEIQQGSLIKAGSKYKASDLAELKRYLHSGDNDDIAAGTKAWSDIKASAMQSIRDKAFTGPETELGTQSLSRAKLTQALNEIGQQKFNVLFSPKEKQFLYDLSAVARFKEPPSGTLTGSGPSAPAIQQLESRIETMFGVKIPVVSAIKGKIAENKLLKLSNDLHEIEKAKLKEQLLPYRQSISASLVSGNAAAAGKKEETK